MKVRFVFGIFLSCLFIINITAHGQSALDGFNPNANGTIRAFVVQADGKILIGGEFTVVQGITRNRLARLNPDGTLDTGFDPNVNYFVFALALQPDGKIIAGGLFTGVAPNGGATVTRNNIARFNADGTLDATFDPNLNNFIFSIVVQPDGRIIAGGGFTSAAPNGGAAVTRNHIARFNTDGTLDTAFDPNVSDEIYSIAIQSDGRILIVGNFSAITPNGGTGYIRWRIARLNANGTLDTTVNLGVNHEAYTVAIQSDGKFLVGGLFTGVLFNGGAFATRNRIVRFNADGTLDTAFNPNANNTVLSIVIQPDGKILAGGNFTGFSPNGGAAVTRNNMTRINLDGTLDAVFNPNVNGQVDSMAVQLDGKILVGGIFTTVGGQTRNRAARLERNGLLDRTLDLNTVGSAVFTISTQPDGKIIIGGDFTNILGTARSNIARLNADGTLDTAFNPNANSSVYAIAVQSDGKIIVGGVFTSINGQTRNNIARLNADGALDTAFNPNANSGVYAIAIQSDGKIVVGGGFTNIGDNTRSHIARLDAMSGLADSWNPSSGSEIYTIVIQPDGKILAGGYFTIIGGQPRNRIARLDATTGLADSWNPNAGSQVYAIALQSDGKILAGGNFNSIGGQMRNGIARLNATSGLADSWNPNVLGSINSISIQSDGKIVAGGNFISIGGQARNHIARLNATTGSADAFNPNANTYIYATALQSDGKILAGGSFTNIGGATRNGIARLSNNTAALSTLDVNQTTLILTRDGSAPQFTRVIFEQSVDNGANWTLLGTATNSSSSFGGSKNNESENPLVPQAAGYNLTGQNILTGQNVLIRARGYFRSGIYNGAETTEDKVRNVFLFVPSAASVSISGRVMVGKNTGVRNARVILTDSHGNTRTVLSSSFGYYRFENVAVGEIYVLNVYSKRYQFNPQVVSVMEEINDLNFSALP